MGHDKPLACQGCPFFHTGIGFVQPIGPEEARLRFIGEAPGEDEVEEGAPFVGRAGAELDAAFITAGVERQKVWIGNTIQCRPPGNNYALVPEEAVDYCQRAHVPRPPVGSVEVLVGGHALPLRVRGAESILNWRGSLIPTQHGFTIPTIHPAYILRGQWKLRGLFVMDIKAARDLAQRNVLGYQPPEGGIGERSEPVHRSSSPYRSSSPPPSNSSLVARHIIHPPRLHDGPMSEGQWLALDVEARPDKRLDIVGFTTNGEEVRQYDAEDVGGLQRYVNSAEVVIAHNAPYDIRMLENVGVRIPRAKVIDTMLTQTMLRSDLEVGLNDSVAAMLPGRWAYHKALWGFKKDGREKEREACRWVWENILGEDLGLDTHRYRVYNALDVASTWRLWQKQYAELELT